jgi:hypothetical protein
VADRPAVHGDWRDAARLQVRPARESRSATTTGRFLHHLRCEPRRDKSQAGSYAGNHSRAAWHAAGAKLKQR